MASFLHKSYIKIFLLVAGSLVFAFFVLSFLGSLLLTRTKANTEKRIGSVFNQTVIIEKISYSFPRTIALHNVSFYSDARPEAREILAVRQMRVVFSLFDSLKKGKLMASRLVLRGASFQAASSARFIREHREEIVAFIKSLPLDQDFYCSIKKASLIFDEDTKAMSPVLFDSFLNIADRHLVLKGAVYFAQAFLSAGRGPQTGSAPPPWKYLLSGVLSEEEFTVESALLDYGDFHLKLWGMFSRNTLSLSGFSQTHNFLYYDGQPQKKQRKSQLFSRKARLSGAGNESISFDPSLTYISDIACLLRFDTDKVVIEKIDFSIGNTPFLIKGEISFEKQPRLDMKLASFPHENLSFQKFNPKKFDIRLVGVWLDSAFSGKLDANFFRKTKRVYKEEQLKVDFNALRAKRAKEHFLKVTVDGGEVLYASGKNKYDISFDNFQAFFDMNLGRIRSFEFNSDLYDGFVTGQGAVDVGFVPPRSGIDFVIIDVSPKYFDSIVPFFSKISGKLRCQGYYRNDPGMKVNGSVIVEDGMLTDFQFFIWLADFFKITSLRSIDFNSISADFIMTEDIIQLENMEINSASLSLEGYFHLLYTDFVSGLLSLKIPRDVLVASPRFKTLLRMLGPDFDVLSFEFQLSGLFADMNFRWLDSRFKKNLQDSIPDFIERGIERKVERLIDRFYK